MTAQSRAEEIEQSAPGFEGLCREHWRRGDKNGEEQIDEGPSQHIRKVI